jgi:hypothetical protein
MMHKKGQGAMEYLMTYGWAILVVVIVGVVLWQMGIFSPSGGAAPGMSGFGNVRPNEYSCSGGIVSAVVVNAAGQMIYNLEMNGEDVCGDNNLSAGKTTICTSTTGVLGCSGVPAGSRYEAEINFTYNSGTPDGLARTSAGTIWGPAE